MPYFGHCHFYIMKKKYTLYLIIETLVVGQRKTLSILEIIDIIETCEWAKGKPFNPFPVKLTCFPVESISCYILQLKGQGHIV